MQLLKALLLLHPITVTDTIEYVLAAVWVGMVLLGLWSVYSRPLSWASKLLWTLVIACVPIAGLFVYSVACAFAADWGLLSQMGFFSRSRKKITSSLESSPSISR